MPVPEAETAPPLTVAPSFAAVALADAEIEAVLIVLLAAATAPELLADMAPVAIVTEAGANAATPLAVRAADAKLDEPLAKVSDAVSPAESAPESICARPNDTEATSAPVSEPVATLRAVGRKLAVPEPESAAVAVIAPERLVAAVADAEIAPDAKDWAENARLTTLDMAKEAVANVAAPIESDDTPAVASEVAAIARAV